MHTVFYIFLIFTASTQAMEEHISYFRHVLNELIHFSENYSLLEESERPIMMKSLLDCINNHKETIERLASYSNSKADCNEDKNKQ